MRHELPRDAQPETPTAVPVAALAALDRLEACGVLASAEAVDALLPPCGPVPGLPGPERLRERARGGWTARTAASQDRGGVGEDGAELAVRLLEEYGPGFTPAQAAGLWLRTAPALRLGPAERAAYEALRDGTALPVVDAVVEASAVVDPAVVDPDGGAPPGPCCWEADDALARADVFGYAAPGDPRRAARLARKEAAMSQAGDGLYGAMWAAALTSAAFTADDAERAVAVSLRHVPASSRLGAAVCDVLVAYVRGLAWEDVADGLCGAPGHAAAGAAAAAGGLLWGGGTYGGVVAAVERAGGARPVVLAASVAGVLAGRGILGDGVPEPAGAAEWAARTLRVAAVV